MQLTNYCLWLPAVKSLFIQLFWQGRHQQADAGLKPIKFVPLNPLKGTLDSYGKLVSFIFRQLKGYTRKETEEFHVHEGKSS